MINPVSQYRALLPKNVARIIEETAKHPSADINFFSGSASMEGITLVPVTEAQKAVEYTFFNPTTPIAIKNTSTEIPNINYFF